MEKKNKNYNKVCTILHVNFAILAYAGTGNSGNRNKWAFIRTGILKWTDRTLAKRLPYDFFSTCFHTCYKYLQHIERKGHDKSCKQMKKHKLCFLAPPQNVKIIVWVCVFSILCMKDSLAITYTYSIIKFNDFISDI